MPSANPPSFSTIAYKILTANQYKTWLSLLSVPTRGKLFTGAGIDLVDKYIHLSTASQVRETYQRYYFDINRAEHRDASPRSDGDSEFLVLVEIDLSKVQGEVRWEVAPKRGEAFAHVYGGGIPLVEDGEKGQEGSAVLRVWEGDQVTMGLFDEIAAEAKGSSDRERLKD